MIVVESVVVVVVVRNDLWIYTYYDNPNWIVFLDKGLGTLNGSRKKLWVSHTNFIFLASEPKQFVSPNLGTSSIGKGTATTVHNILISFMFSTISSVERWQLVSWSLKGRDVIDLRDFFSYWLSILIMEEIESIFGDFVLWINKKNNQVFILYNFYNGTDEEINYFSDTTQIFVDWEKYRFNENHR